MKNLGSLLFALILGLGCEESPAAQSGGRDTGASERDGEAAAHHASHPMPEAGDGGLSLDADSGPLPAPDAGTPDAGMPDASMGAPSPLCRGDVVLETDAEVAEIAQCSAIGGSLTITGEGLSEVDLPLLETIGSKLAVDSSALHELELPVLESVGGALYVNHNQLLERIAFPALLKTRGTLAVGGFTDASEDSQPALRTIELPALVEVGDDALDSEGIRASLHVEANGALSSVQLPALQRVHAQVTIMNNYTLTVVDLPALENIGEDVEIRDNDMLATVRAPALAEQGGRLFFIEGKALSAVELPMLRHAGIIAIRSDGDLPAVELPALESAETLAIGPTTATRLAFPKLNWIYAVLAIRDNPLLTSLELPLLADVGKDWAGVLDSDAFGIEITNNAGLASVQMPALKEVGNDLAVLGNPLLTSLDLSALGKVTNDLEIRGTGLTQLSAPLLTSLGGSEPGGGNGTRVSFGGLIIADNPSLASALLPGLTAAYLDFRVTNNPMLPTCDAQALASQLTTSPVGSVTIEGNAGTCP